VTGSYIDLVNRIDEARKALMSFQVSHDFDCNIYVPGIKECSCNMKKEQEAIDRAIRALTL